MSKKNNIRTSETVASKASKILRSSKSTKLAKSVAASNLSNRRKKTP